MEFRYRKLVIMVFYYSFVIIALFIFLPKIFADSRLKGIARVIVKDSGSNWFLKSSKYCSIIPFYNNKEKPLLEITSHNYTTSLEIILDIIISKTFQTKLNQSELILIATDIDKEATTLVSDIIAPYENIILFDVNRNNYDVSYQQNSAPLYSLVGTKDFANFIIRNLYGKNLVSIMENYESDLYEYAIKYTDICIMKYTFENISYLSVIVNDLISYKHVDKLDILLEGSYSDLNIFLNICESNGLKIRNMYLNVAYISFPDAELLFRKYKNTVELFLYLIGFTINASRNNFCNYFMPDMSSENLNLFCNSQKNPYFHFINMSWSNIHNRTNFYMTIAKNFTSDKIEAPECALISCPPGYEQKLTSLSTKVKKHRWRSCFRCLENYYKESSGSDECQKCPSEFVSNTNKTACIDSFTLDALTFQSVKGLIITAFSIFCSLFSIFTIATLFYKRNTPVVKSANFSLFTAQIVCHLLISLSVPLLYIIKPVFITCSTRHVIVGFLFTTSASIVYIKTKKYLRIFQTVYRLSNKEKIVATSMDIIIVVLIMIVQMLIGAILLIKSPPAVLTHLNYEKMTRTFQCSSDWQFAAQVLYIGFLLLMCSVQSFHARNLPSYFNETHSITYSAGISCILLICYFPIYYGNDNIKARIFAVPLLILVVNLTFMGITLTPKLFVIYLKPKTNTKSSLHTEMKMYSKTISFDS